MTGLAPLSGPRDVVGLRAHLLNQWRLGGPFAYSTEARRTSMRASGHPAAVDDDDRYTRPEDYWHRAVLQDAALWWVDAEMVDLLEAAETGLPTDAILEATLPPQGRGLVVFERPLSGIDSEGEGSVLVDAICWGEVNIVAHNNVRRPALGIASYRRLNFDTGWSADDLTLAAGHGGIDVEALRPPDYVGPDRDGVAMVVLHGDVWFPLGRSDWLIGERIDATHPGLLPGPLLDSAVEDRRRLATLWLLASQPGIAETAEDHGTRAEQRRETRATGRPPSPVRIVSLPHRPHPSGPRPEEPSGRHVSVRFPVAGFWRNQPYGPKRAYRRPTWVSAHWRGPADAPVSIREQVRVLRPPTDAELEAAVEEAQS